MRRVTYDKFGWGSATDDELVAAWMKPSPTIEHRSSLVKEMLWRHIMQRDEWGNHVPDEGRWAWNTWAP